MRTVTKGILITLIILGCVAGFISGPVVIYEQNTGLEHPTQLGSWLMLIAVLLFVGFFVWVGRAIRKVLVKN